MTKKKNKYLNDNVDIQCNDSDMTPKTKTYEEWLADKNSKK